MGSNLRTIRNRLGMTQAALASVFRVTPAMVCHYETDRVELPARLARELIHHAATHGDRVTFDDIYGQPQPQGEAA